MANPDNQAALHSAPNDDPNTENDRRPVRSN